MEPEKAAENLSLQNGPMQAKVDDLMARRSAALEMGGPERIERQHKAGKTTVRERIAMLIDSDTFREYGVLATHSAHRAETKGMVTPADGVVTGFGRVDGRQVGVIAEDFTVRGGSLGTTGIAKKLRMVEIATRERVPLIWLLDGAGARAEEFIAEGMPPITHHLKIAQMSGIAPQVGLVMGPSAGDSSLVAAALEFIVMVKGTGMMAAGGPPIVRSALNIDVDKETLGGVDVHCRISGVADNIAKDDADAIDQCKRYLSYLPSNAWQYPPDAEPTDDPRRMDESLLTAVPENLKRPYDMKDVIEAVVDHDSFFEIKPEFAKMLITGLGRLNGHPVGILANQPKVYAGSITAKAAAKARRFIDLCSAYHLPIVSLADVPGVMTGPDAEREGTLRQGLAACNSLAWADVPLFTVVVHKMFGFGGGVMGGYGLGQTLTLAWPTADFGSLPVESGVFAAYPRELEEAEKAGNYDEVKAQLEQQFLQYCGPYPASDVFNVDDVIDPRETRPRLIEALELALSRRVEAAAPKWRHGVLP